MAVNAASSSYVNNASSNKGFSGLASGVDTESMVEQLLSGTQTKIDKQEGLKQQLQWKQEIYRDIISQINTFQTKFFSYSSSSNLTSASFWNAMSAASTSGAFKATATSSAATGSSSMAVRRLATKSSVTSAQSVSGDLTGKLDTDALKKMVDTQMGTAQDYNVKFKVGDKTVSVDLQDIFVDAAAKTFKPKTSTTQLDSNIQKKLQDAFDAAGVKVTASVKDGAVKLVTEGDNRPIISVSGDSGKLGLQKLGLTANASSVNNSSAKTSTLSGEVDAVPKMEFTVTLDDLKKTVSIDLRDVMDNSGNISRAKLQNALTNGIAKSHGTGQVNVDIGADGSVKMWAGPGRKVDIGGSDAAMAVLGMKNGASNRISLGSKLGDLNLGTKLQGGSFRFTINGEEFHFTEDTAIIDVMDTINRSDAGVRMVYRAQDDKFVLEAKESGAGKEIDMEQEEGNLINALFGAGVASGKRVVSKKLVHTLADADGKIAAATGDTKLSDLGITPALQDKNGNAISGDTKLSDLKEASGGLYEFADGKITKEVTGDTTLEDLGLTLAGIPAATKLSDLSGTFRYEDGHIIATRSYSAPGPNTKATLEKLFGSESITVKDDSGAKFVSQAGQNALVVVDGVVTERSSNNFTINGINYDINDITGSYSDVSKKYTEVTFDNTDGKYKDADGKEYALSDLEQYEKEDTTIGYRFLTYVDADGNTVNNNDLVDVGGVMQKFTGTTAKVTVTQDTDKIMDSIKEFIDEYNKLVKTLNDYLDEDTNYRDYSPLTAAQKKEMSEREIELWEEKAKEGLLHRDSTIQTFLQQMRTALYQKPAGASYALYELGIETGTWDQKGQLTFSTDGESRLRQLLENDPTGVASLFTNPGDGLATTLNNILKATAQTTSGSPGTLVQLAGVKGMASDKNNSLYDQMKAIDDKIAALKKTYEAEKTRYWKQFNTMEQLISEMNTQSSYLAQMMGG